MHSKADAKAFWIALVTAAVLVFQSLIATLAPGAVAAAAGQPGVTIIICTASGPRVMTLEMVGESAAPQDNSHEGALPHCCLAGCAMAGSVALPVPYFLAWHLPPPPEPVVVPAVDIPSFTSVLARSPGRPRAPPARSS